MTRLPLALIFVLSFSLSLFFFPTFSVSAKDKVVVIPMIEITKAPSEPLSLIPDTGQVIVYTNIFGEDRDYSINPLSYTNNNDGTVTDNVTKLLWERADATSTKNWINAWNYCLSLSIGGKGNWRLPTATELVSIVHYDKSSPAIDSIFTDTDSAHYWSATTLADDPAKAMSVDFTNGFLSVSKAKTELCHVRCVNGNTAWGLYFKDNGNGTVTDLATGLTWQQRDDDQKRDWEDAIVYCESLTLAGHNDWRLPNIKTLHTIVDVTTSDPAIDSTYFPGTDLWYYWSSTSNSTSNLPTIHYAYHVPWWDGDISDEGISDLESYVRCVRGGQ